ncbi:MAG: SufE family protein [Alphaproteobacteria bacterium]|nr:MAG: SufE family protein [Alphaproteobacteria bacterium]
MASTIDDILADFDFLDDWDDRYRYVIELGRTLAPLPEEAHNDETKVQGCVSQVWLVSETDDAAPPRLYFQGDSDAHIVKGLIAILLSLYSGKTAQEILAIDAKAILAKMGLDTHLTPQRSNGLHSMIQRIQSDARATLEDA